MAGGSVQQDEVAEAVWQVLAERGFAGLTIRAVAAALGRTTGLVMHRFPTKEALTAFAFEVLEARTDGERPSTEGDGRQALRAALIGMLPLDAGSTTTNRAWIASWDAALAGEALRTGHAERYRRGRERLRALLERAGADDAAGAADRLQGAMLGLIVQSVLDPEAHPPDDRLARVERLLEEALRPAAVSAPSPSRPGDR